ncbi:MAG: FliG C-terminal domain-containing protein [Candidatus Coatesbacteria bacterium]
MSKPLPLRPNLDQLKNQAKDILKAHERQDAGVCGRLKALNRFAKSSDADILAGAINLSEAQFVLALEYGFKTWGEMKTHIESAGASPPFAKLEDLEGLGNRSIEVLMRDIDTRDLAVAMLNIPPGLYEKLWKNLSQEARAVIKEEWGAIGTADPAAVEAAHRKILEIANKLADELKPDAKEDSHMPTNEWETALIKEIEKKPVEFRTAAELVPIFFELSRVARREGLVAMEDFVTNHVGDDLLKLGLREVIGGTDMSVVMGVLEARKATLIQSYERRLSMIVAAVEGIGSGLNPRLMEEKCRAFLT